MKFKEFVKNHLIYIIIGLMNLAMIGFLFAPLLTYETKYYVGEEKVKEYFSKNIIGLFDTSITKTWLAIVLLVFIGIILITTIVVYIVKKHNKVQDIFSTINLITLAVLVAYILLMKELFNYFAGEMGMVENFNGASIAWGTGAIIFFAALSFFLMISISSFAKQSVRTMSEDAIFLALAFVLSFIKIPLGATGGSINFQMFPLMIIALRRGPLVGFICSGFIYGLITCITDGYGFATFPFDYLIGFGSAAIMGFFRTSIYPEKPAKLKYLLPEIFILVGGILSTLVRFIGSTTSSMVIYGYTLEAALAYNAIYIPVSGAAAIVLLMVMHPTLDQINRRYPAK